MDTKQVKVKCKLCNTVLCYKNWVGSFVSCSCGSVSVDKTDKYAKHIRIIGEPKNYEVTRDGKVVEFDYKKNTSNTN